MKQRFWFLLPFSLAMICLLIPLYAVLANETQPAVASHEKDTADRLFLLIGVDQVSYSSDAMMLVRVESGKISFLQLPRDSLISSGKRLNSIFSSACYAAKNDGKRDKTAFSEGGRALSDFLERALGITIDAHATLTLSGLRSLVDAIGGVDVTVEKTLSYRDPVQDLVIFLEKGEHHLDGAAAESLVRCRNAYPDADYGRMRAQRSLVRAVYEKLKQEFSPITLLTLFRKAYSEVETDMPLREALPLLQHLKGEETALSFASLTGKTVTLHGASLEVLSEINLQKASDYLGGVFQKDSAERAFCLPNSQIQAIYHDPLPLPFTVSE